MATGRSRKKNKFKFNERSASSVRDHCSADPAFTDDVRHLALPLRRNSGPESEAAKMFGKKKSKSNSKEEHSSHYSLRLERRKNSNVQANNYSAEYLCKNSSSSESLDNIISSYKLKGRKGFSLDRNIQSFDVEQKPQSKPKRSSWFLRDRNRDKQSKKEKFLKRSSLDFTVMYDTKQSEKPRSKAKPIQRQNAADYTGDSSTTTPQDETMETKKSGLTKFQIGKRFLKGEIGIRSFNYYLLKEGLKKNQGKQKQESITTKPTYKSKSEENIYEEIYFLHDQLTPKPKSPPALPPFNKQSSVPLLKTPKKPMSDDGNCMNCEICLQEASEKHSTCSLKNCDKCSHQKQNLMTGSLSGSEGYAQVNKKINDKSIYDFFQQQQNQGQTVLQFQSYNPSNPSVYKIESTPVAFDYTPIEEQIYQMELSQQYSRGQQQNLSGDGKVMPKSSSSNDSIKGHNQRHRHHQQQQQSNEFYTRPNFCYPTNDSKQSRKDQGNVNNNSMYKTDSSNSIRSENSLSKIYNSKNSSQKSNQSNKSSKSVNSNHNRDEAQLRQDMSDSSLGDSLFSSDANKRYFGSSESCRFNYECRRRCSLENEKCSFSDTCRYECNLRNCDCSSSYFSSDFDDTNIYNTTNNNNNRLLKSHHQQQQQQQPIEYQQQQIYEQKTNRYAEDFIKHVTNVKRRSQNIPYDGSNVLISTQQLSIYEVPKQHPKRLEMETTVSLRNEIETSKMTGGYYCDENVGLKESDRMMMHEHDKTSFVERKATGTVPKLSSSISSNESKKKKSGQKNDKENKQKEAIRVVTAESEIISTVKTVHNDGKLLKDGEIFPNETLSATLEMNSTEKPKSTLEKAKNEQQKSIDVIDDDDDVFLESHPKKTTKDCDTKVEKPLEIKQSEVVKPETITKLADNFIAPNKAPLKAPSSETLKVDVKQATNIKQNDSCEIKNNNKATLSKPNVVVANESDDDDSVFINENKPKKASKTSKTNVQPASNDASSVMLSGANVSSSNIKPTAPVAAQNHNSRDLNVKSETVVR